MIVLDASALLALLFNEPGSDAVASALGDCCMSTVNLAEVLSRFARDGKSVATLWAKLSSAPIEWVAADTEQALKAAELAAIARPLGLSLGDRVCLALAHQRRLPALTADRVWLEADLGVAVRCIR